METFLYEMPLINDHSNGLFVDFRDETNIDTKSSFGYQKEKFWIPHLCRKRIFAYVYN